MFYLTQQLTKVSVFLRESGEYLSFIFRLGVVEYVGVHKKHLLEL